MGFSKLIEQIEEIAFDAAVDVSKKNGDAYELALDFFRSNRMPDGETWPRDVTPEIDFKNDIEILNPELHVRADGGLTYTARFRLAPGDGGGAGVGIDDSSSSYLFNMLGRDGNAERGMKKAFETVVRADTRKLNETFRKFIKDPENVMHMIVGWADRDLYVIEDAMLKDIQYGDAMMNPDRQRWPSGELEIWIPITADVVINLKRANAATA